MKKVFSSNAQLSHAWANQLQSEGRGSSMFFYNDTIYSYGYHYQIARIIEAPTGQKVAFVNDNGYSNSTAKHTNHVWQAIPDYVPAFRVPFIGNKFEVDTLGEVVAKVMGNIEGLICEQLKARTDFRKFSEASRMYDDIKDICAFFNLPTPKKCDKWEEARKKSEQLRATQGEREEARKVKELEKSRELLGKWLNNEYNGTLYNIPVHLRLSKDRREIQTTQGASVPLSEGVRLLAKLRAGEDVKGYKIAGFSVIQSTPEAVKIGCHTINWPTINEFFAGVEA